MMYHQVWIEISRVRYCHTDIIVETLDSSTATMTDSATTNNNYERATPTADSEQTFNSMTRKYILQCIVIIAATDNSNFPNRLMYLVYNLMLFLIMKIDPLYNVPSCIITHIHSIYNPHTTLPLPPRSCISYSYTKTIAGKISN